MLLNNIYLQDLNITYSFVYLYIVSYIFTLFSFLLLLYKTSCISNQTLPFSRIFCWNFYVRSFTLAIILSFCGVPPFLGFFTKFYVFFSISNLSDKIILLNFIFTNFFVFYFYSQYFRHLYFYNQNKLYITKYENISYKITFFFFLFFFINFFSYMIIDYLCIWVLFIHCFF